MYRFAIRIVLSEISDYNALDDIMESNKFRNSVLMGGKKFSLPCGEYKHNSYKNTKEVFDEVLSLVASKFDRGTFAILVFGREKRLFCGLKEVSQAFPISSKAIQLEGE